MIEKLEKVDFPPFIVGKTEPSEVLIPLLVATTEHLNAAIDRINNLAEAVGYLAQHYEEHRHLSVDGEHTIAPKDTPTHEQH